MLSKHHQEPIGSLLRSQHLISSFDTTEYTKLIQSFLATLDRNNTLSLIFNSLLQSKDTQLINTLDEIVSSILNDRLKQNQFIPQQKLAENAPWPVTTNCKLLLIDLPSNVIESIASTLCLDDLLSFEKTNRFISSCCRTSQASKFLIGRHGTQDWFKKLISLNYPFYNEHTNTLTHQSNLTSFVHRWNNPVSMQLKLGRKIRRGIDDFSMEKPHYPWCKDKYLHFVGNLVLKPLFKTVKNLALTTKDHNNLALFDNIQYEFPNLESLALCASYSHDVIQFVGNHRFPNLKHLKFSSVRHDTSLEDNISRQSMTDSLLDPGKDYTADIVQFLNTLIPNYDSIHKYLDPDNELNEIQKIHAEYEELSLVYCIFESQIGQYDDLFTDAFSNQDVIRIAMSNIKRLEFTADTANDTICVRLVVSILMEHSKNLRALHIEIPTPPTTAMTVHTITTGLYDVDLDFSNLKELSVGIQSNDVAPDLGYIVERCHTLQSFKLSIQHNAIANANAIGSKLTLEAVLDGVVHFCVNNAESLEYVEFGIYCNDNVSITTSLSFLSFAIKHLDTRKLRSCKWKLIFRDDNHDIADYYRYIGLALVTIHEYCVECIVVIQSRSPAEELGEALLQYLPNMYELHWKDRFSLSLKKIKL